MASLSLGLLFNNAYIDDITAPDDSAASSDDEVPLNPPPSTFPLPSLQPKYDTSELAFIAVNTFAKPYGYALTRKRSKTTKKGVMKTVRLGCDRGRRYIGHTREERIRKTSTLANQCPFSMSVRLDLQSDTWYLTVEDETHNHLPSPGITHPVHRRLEYPRDIYNIRGRLIREYLNGRTPIQALMEELPKGGNWIFKYEVDEQHHITALFCMHRTSLAMLKHHPWVISMDCTYKTNRFGLPMLDIVGFTPTGATFHVALAFIQDEKQETYTVILRCLAEAYDSLGLAYPRTILTDKEKALINAIRQVFRLTNIMVCLWHINMNIMKKARPLLGDQIAIARRDNISTRPMTKAQMDKELRQMVDTGWKKMLQGWNRIVYADSVSAFQTSWTWFQAQYSDPIFLPILQYIEDEWLNDCPEQFLHIHTAHYLHLHESATSRTESAHWLLKRELQSSTNDLLVVLQSFERALNRHYADI
ncbi:hypothetical protein N7448_011138 [Penicillium atrosanguineum]|nr:hypothetical protein N7448_011138 [Penicillium atrosanguineum]